MPSRPRTKGGVIYDAHELRVTAAEINDFRVRRYNITLLPRAELAHRQFNGLFFVTAWNCTPKIEAVFILLFSYVNTSSSALPIILYIITQFI